MWVPQEPTSTERAQVLHLNRRPTRRGFSAALDDESDVIPTVQEILGRRPRTFEQWAAAHAAAFR
jgi:hypothetical protein